jgi:phosphatidate cytidylyltransferase
MRRRLSSTFSASSFSASILKRAPYISNISQEDKKINASVSEPQTKGKWSSLKPRTLFGLLMILGLYLILLIGPTAVIALIAIVQTMVFREVISIAHARSLEKKLPWFRSITW